MKNPLNKRLPRDMKHNFGRYFVIFMFLTLTIGLISGYLVANTSMQIAFKDSFKKYNIEDCNFEIPFKAEDSLIDTLEDEDITIYDNYYVEEDALKDTTLRIYKVPTKVNKVSVLKGKKPLKDNEIALDRLYAVNNNIDVGDTIKINKKKFKVTGYVALSNYTAVFKKNSDMMFDANNFGVAIVTEEGFEDLNQKEIHYSYSYKFNDKHLTDKEKREKSKDIVKILSSNTIVTSYTLEENNQSIHFAGDDIGKDKSMMIWLLYILIFIMAFIFAVTIINTIDTEAVVIGTLLSSGYSRWELVRHYCKLPIIVSLVAAVIGNILGYSLFKGLMADLYYGSYSFPTYKTIWNAEAFILTTIVPIVIMIIINVVALSHKLAISPLKFLRHDLSKKKNKKALKLPNFKFKTRFRLRVIIQNISNYIVLFVGILFATFLLLFCLMMPTTIDKTKDSIKNSLISKYQYILKTQVETENKDAEKFATYSVEMNKKIYSSDEGVTVYGLQNKSKYVDLDFDDNSNGVYICDGILKKYGVSVGDNIELKDSYNDKKYKFKVLGTYDYPASMAIFMDIDDFNKCFNHDKDYFNGYLSDSKIKDIDEVYIATIIKLSDMTNLCDQMTASMGSMFDMCTVVCGILYIVLMYLLTKVVIEKNSNSISMVKVFGFNDKEVSSFYLHATTIVVIVSLVISIPISEWLLSVLFKEIMKSMTGWFTMYIDATTYIKTFVIGIICYILINLRQVRKINKIPMEEALKNRE